MLPAKSGILLNQNGAMFGLDARIAMAIFSALIVVVGYVGFGRIQTARQAALVADVDAIENALTNYQADLGTFYMFTLEKSYDTGDTTEDITALWDKSKVKQGFQGRWNGPYLHRTSRARPPYGLFSVSYATEDRDTECTSQTKCYVWLSLTKVPAEVWGAVDNYYDDTGSQTPETETARIRTGKVQADTEGQTRTLYVRTVSRTPEQE